ncbi:MAG: SMC-Scp complex subunit ScpB [Bacillota bacterium]|nr:SMC-Scp complex subunit ScpB [Bacillota bacterium]
MKPQEALRMLEALVFAAPEPLRIKEAAEIVGLDTATTANLLRRLCDEYAARGAGLVLEEVAGGWRMVTAPDLAEAVARLGRSPRQGPLSPAALETLAIVAYRQPVTRAEVEAIRGVHSESALRTLEERGLIREVGRREGLGRPLEYGTTDAFLAAFGLRSLAELPPLPEPVLPPEGDRGAAGRENRPETAERGAPRCRGGC